MPASPPGDPTRAFATTLWAMIASFAAMLFVMAWAAINSQMRLEPPDAICLQHSEAPGDETTRVSGEWSWTPPGLRCAADYGGSAGWREFAAPSWWELLIPLTLLLIGLTWLALAATSTVRRTARLSGYGRATGVFTLLFFASALVVLSSPVAFDRVGGLAVVWVPAALIVAAPLLIATGFLVRPRSNQKSGSGAMSAPTLDLYRRWRVLRPLIRGR